MLEKYIALKITVITGISIFLYTDNRLITLSGEEWLDFIVKTKNADVLSKCADSANIPIVYRDETDVFYICVKAADSYVIAGPMCTNTADYGRIHDINNRYGTEIEKSPPKMTFEKIIALAAMLGYECGNGKFTDEEIIKANGFSKLENTKREQLIFSIKEDEEELYHHTYRDERHLLECVRDGHSEEAVQCTRSMDSYLGRMAESEINHKKNAVIVGITLCTRAAIEGGVSPATAYRLSDFYIQKADKCKDAIRLIEIRNDAVADFAERVRNKKENIHSSAHIEKCKAYIAKHYREKIYLDDAADGIGLNSSYLSRLFKKETGISFNDYLNKLRVERAANLLMYSEETITRIGEYTGFPSQSYFTKIFKKYKDETPNEFRNRHKPSEFI